MAQTRGWSRDEKDDRANTLAGLIQKAWRFVMRALVGNGKTMVSMSDLNELPSLWAQQVDGPLLGYLGMQVLDGAERVRQDIGLGSKEQLLTEDFVEQHLLEAANRFRYLSEDVWDAIHAQLLKGYALDEDIKQIAARIKHVGNVSDQKALTIARTEIHAALEAGSYAQAALADPDGKKSWLATNDSHTRPTHDEADGQTRKIAEPFMVGRSHLQYPGDPRGALDETINCRCSVTYELFPDVTAEDEDELALIAAVYNWTKKAAGGSGWDPDEHPRDPHSGEFIDSLSDIEITKLLKGYKDKGGGGGYHVPKQKKAPPTPEQIAAAKAAEQRRIARKYGGRTPEQIAEIAKDPKKFIILPAALRGKSGDKYLVKNQQWRIWGTYGSSGVMIKAPNEDGEDSYLFIQRGKAVSNTGKWQLPGGAMDQHETPAQGAARETYEELHVSQKYMDGVRHLGTHVTVQPIEGQPTPWQYTNIAAEADHQFEPQVDHAEVMNAQWLTRPQIAMMIRDGDFHPALAGSLAKIFDIFDTGVSTTETNEIIPADPPKPAKSQSYKFVMDMALTAGGIHRKWQPEQHPRGKDGKFIRKGPLATFFQMNSPTFNQLKEAVDSLDQPTWDNLTEKQKGWVSKLTHGISSSPSSDPLKHKLVGLENNEKDVPASEIVTITTPVPQNTQLDSPPTSKGASYDLLDFTAPESHMNQGSAPDVIAAAKVRRDEYASRGPLQKKIADFVGEWTGQDSIDKLSELRNQLKTSHKDVVAEAFNGPTAPKLYRGTKMSKQKFFDLKNGENLDLRGLSAFSEDDTHIEGFGGTQDSHATIIELTDARGLPIQGISNSPYEREWLIPGKIEITGKSTRSSKVSLDAKTKPLTIHVIHAKWLPADDAKSGTFIGNVPETHKNAVPVIPSPVPTPLDYDEPPKASNPITGKQIPGSKKFVPATIHKPHADGTVIAISADGEKRLRWNAGNKTYFFQKTYGGPNWQTYKMLTKAKAYEVSKESYWDWRQPVATPQPKSPPHIVTPTPIEPLKAPFTPDAPGSIAVVMNVAKPDPAKMKKIGNAATGVSASPIYIDENGQRWLVRRKKNQSDDPVLELDVAANKLQTAMGLKGPKTYIMDVDGQPGAVQAMFDAKDAFPQGSFKPTQLSESDVRDMQKEQVLDWLLGNNDAHSGQFIRLPNGHISSIDKGHAFRFYAKDKLTEDYKPWSPLSPNKHTYPDMWKAYANGENIEMHDPNKDPEISQTIQKAQELTDDEIRDIFGGYAQGAAKNGWLGAYNNDPETFLKAIMKRRDGLHDDFAKLYANTTAKRDAKIPKAPEPVVKMAYPTKSDTWWEPEDDLTTDDIADAALFGQLGTTIGVTTDGSLVLKYDVNTNMLEMYKQAPGSDKWAKVDKLHMPSDYGNGEWEDNFADMTSYHSNESVKSWIKGDVGVPHYGVPSNIAQHNAEIDGPPPVAPPHVSAFGPSAWQQKLTPELVDTLLPNQIVATVTTPTGDYRVISGGSVLHTIADGQFRIQRKQASTGNWVTLEQYVNPNDLPFVVEQHSGTSKWNIVDFDPPKPAPNAGADITNVSPAQIGVIKTYFNANGAKWHNKPEAIWDALQNFKKSDAGVGLEHLNDLQIFATLDAATMVKDKDDPYQTKMKKWLGSSKGLDYVSKNPITVVLPPSSSPSPTGNVVTSFADMDKWPWQPGDIVAMRKDGKWRITYTDESKFAIEVNAEPGNPDTWVPNGIVDEKSSLLDHFPLDVHSMTETWYAGKPSGDTSRITAANIWNIAPADGKATIKKTLVTGVDPDGNQYKIKQDGDGEGFKLLTVYKKDATGSDVPTGYQFSSEGQVDNFLQYSATGNAVSWTIVPSSTEGDVSDVSYSTGLFNLTPSPDLNDKIWGEFTKAKVGEQFAEVKTGDGDVYSFYKKAFTNDVRYIHVYKNGESNNQLLDKGHVDNYLKNNNLLESGSPSTVDKFTGLSTTSNYTLPDGTPVSKGFTIPSDGWESIGTPSGSSFLKLHAMTPSGQTILVSKNGNEWQLREYNSVTGKYAFFASGTNPKKLAQDYTSSPWNYAVELSPTASKSSTPIAPSAPAAPPIVSKISSSTMIQLPDGTEVNKGPLIKVWKDLAQNKYGSKVLAYSADGQYRIKSNYGSFTLEKWNTTTNKYSYVDNEQHKLASLSKTVPVLWHDATLVPPPTKVTPATPVAPPPPPDPIGVHGTLTLPSGAKVAKGPIVNAWGPHTKKSQYTKSLTVIAYAGNGKHRLLFNKPESTFKYQTWDETDSKWKTQASDPYKLATLAKDSPIHSWYTTTPKPGTTTASVPAPSAPSVSKTSAKVTVPGGGVIDLGGGDISHISETEKNNIYKQFKAQPATYLSSPSQDIWAALITMADNHGLTKMQVLRVIDDQGAKKVSKPDEHKFEQKIKDWLQTPAGYAILHNLPIPKPPPPKFAPNVDDKIEPLSVSNKHSYPVKTVGETSAWFEKALKSHGVKPSETAKSGVTAYTGGIYHSINAYLYGGVQTISSSNESHMNNAQLAMVPSVEPIMLHRGVGYGAFKAKDLASLQKMVGQVRWMGGFGSTSVGGSPAFGGQVTVEIEAPPGTPMYWAKPISLHKSENEMLLAAGLHYHIISVTPKYGSGATVRVRIVPKPADESQIIAAGEMRW